MAEVWNGNKVPAAEDKWNLVPDLRRLAMLDNRLIPVYSKSERNELANDAPGNVIPDGTTVVRMDQSARGSVFDVFMDNKWMEGDTGVLTSGVGIQGSGLVTIDSYSFRRRGTTVTARVDFRYTGAKVTGNTGNGNLSSMDMFRVGDDWKPIWATYDVTIGEPGASQHFGRIDVDGWVAISNTLPGNYINKDVNLRFDGSWQVP